MHTEIINLIEEGKTEEALEKQAIYLEKMTNIQK